MAVKIQISFFGMRILEVSVLAKCCLVEREVCCKC